MALRPLLLISLASFATHVHAGTYTIVDTYFFSHFNSDGAYSKLNGSEYEFGVTPSASVVGRGNPDKLPTIMDNLRWKVRWTESYPGEPAPLTVHGKLAAYGYAASYTTGFKYSAMGSAVVEARWQDSWTGFRLASRSRGLGDVGDLNSASSTTPAHLGYITIGGTFQQVSPGVYEADYTILPNYAGWHSVKFMSGANGYGYVQSDVNVRVRLIEVDGQTTSSDF